MNKKKCFFVENIKTKVFLKKAYVSFNQKRFPVSMGKFQKGKKWKKALPGMILLIFYSLSIICNISKISYVLLLLFTKGLVHRHHPS